MEQQVRLRSSTPLIVLLFFLALVTSLITLGCLAGSSILVSRISGARSVVSGILLFFFIATSLSSLLALVYSIIGGAQIMRIQLVYDQSRDLHLHQHHHELLESQQQHSQPQQQQQQQQHPVRQTHSADDVIERAAELNEEDDKDGDVNGLYINPGVVYENPLFILSPCRVLTIALGMVAFFIVAVYYAYSQPLVPLSYDCVQFARTVEAAVSASNSHQLPVSLSNTTVETQPVSAPASNETFKYTMSFDLTDEAALPLSMIDHRSTKFMTNIFYDSLIVPEPYWKHSRVGGHPIAQHQQQQPTTAGAAENRTTASGLSIAKGIVLQSQKFNTTTKAPLFPSVTTSVANVRPNPTVSVSSSPSSPSSPSSSSSSLSTTSESSVSSAPTTPTGTVTSSLSASSTTLPSSGTSLSASTDSTPSPSPVSAQGDDRNSYIDVDDPSTSTSDSPNVNRSADGGSSPIDFQVTADSALKLCYLYKMVEVTSTLILAIYVVLSAASIVAIIRTVRQLTRDTELWRTYRSEKNLAAATFSVVSLAIRQHDIILSHQLASRRSFASLTVPTSGFLLSRRASVSTSIIPAAASIMERIQAVAATTVTATTTASTMATNSERSSMVQQPSIVSNQANNKHEYESGAEADIDDDDDDDDGGGNRTSESARTQASEVESTSTGQFLSALSSPQRSTLPQLPELTHQTVVTFDPAILRPRVSFTSTSSMEFYSVSSSFEAEVFESLSNIATVNASPESRRSTSSPLSSASDSGSVSSHGS